MSNECPAVGIFCYSSNALSTFVYGVNLVQKVVTTFNSTWQLSAILDFWMTSLVSHGTMAINQKHLQFKFGDASSTASKVMKILQNSKWPPSAISDC